MKNIYKVITIFILVHTNILFSQTKSFLEWFSFGELEEKNYVQNYNNLNFSKLWTKTKNTQVVGVIGKNHQRIRIKILSVTKSNYDKNKYTVTGKSKVKNTICNFKGTIVVRKVLKRKELDFGVDDFFKGTIKVQGIVIADYHFKENQNQKHSGFFKGELYSKWYLDTKGRLEYDNITSSADSYMNNSYVGIWKSYRTKRQKQCNWGDYRVPMANDDFDIGAAELSPAKKYHKNGWKNYSRAWVNGDKEARRKENITWWK